MRQSPAKIPLQILAEWSDYLAKSTRTNAGPWLIYGAPRSTIIAWTVYLRRYLITVCNSDLFCGRGRLDMSSRISDHYLRSALYFSNFGTFFCFGGMRTFFPSYTASFCNDTEVQGGYFVHNCIFPGYAVLSADFALPCSGIATLVLPLARPALLAAKNDFRSKLLLHPSIYVSDYLARSRLGELAPA